MTWGTRLFCVVYFHVSRKKKCTVGYALPSCQRYSYSIKKCVQKYILKWLAECNVVYRETLHFICGSVHDSQETRDKKTPNCVFWNILWNTLWREKRWPWKLFFPSGSNNWVIMKQTAWLGMGFCSHYQKYWNQREVSLVLLFWLLNSNLNKPLLVTFFLMWIEWVAHLRVATTDSLITDDASKASVN